MLTRQQSRQFDQFVIEQLNIPGLILMENAGRGCAEVLTQFDSESAGYPASVVVLCGPGNNGGDGFVIARHLWNAGCAVQVVMSQPPESYSGDARVMLNALIRLPIRLIQFSSGLTDLEAAQVINFVGRKPATWIVDALLGTGATGALRAPMNQMVAIANQADSRRLAIDTPSGLDCDTGEYSEPSFHAEITCSLIDRKAGFNQPRAADLLGRVQIVPIGVATDRIQALMHQFAQSKPA